MSLTCAVILAPVTMVLLDPVLAGLRAAPSAQINAADPSFQVSSVLHASMPEMRL